MPGMEPIDALQRAVNERGLEWVFEQPELVESLLLDYCQGRKPEIHFLVGALKEQIPQRLLSAQMQAQKEAAAGQARAQLQTNLGMLPEKASWTVRAWLQVLGSGKKAPPGPVDPPKKPDDIVEDRAHALMKEFFGKGASIEQVAGLLAERGLLARQQAAGDAKHYWDGLSAEQQQAIRETRRKANPFTWQQAAMAGLGILAAIFFLYLFCVKVVPVAWFFARMAWTRAASGDYLGALIIVVVFAGLLYGLYRAAKSL